MATFTATFIVNGPGARSAMFTPSPGPFASPLMPGTVVGTVIVDPPDWSGMISVDPPFTMNGSNVVVGADPLASGTYVVNGRCDP